ncbi:MAG TPA: glycosyltransferase family 4 protein [Tepidisphaeraceae bacterium]|jgi:glycosyltransferase involved in cell wall biosynthesis|nr:glycosyltransferase family 4 protein [Tepidisphaeraceae bacterium]
MIYVAMPMGLAHGWGVAGRMITRELAKLDAVRLYTQPIADELFENTFEWNFIRSLQPAGTDPLHPPEGSAVDVPVLKGIPAATIPFHPNLRGTRNVGYTFFEDDLVIKATRSPGFEGFDYLVAGSSWCAEVLRAANYPGVKVILQGVDPQVFNPLFNQKQYLQDQFVVFSGGKLEFRKGQDVVIRAYKVLQDRHKDVALVNVWHNQWSWNAATISASRLINIPVASGPHVEIVNQLLAANGIDVSRVISLPAIANPILPRIYRNTDVGIFPSRCEGGTNLVMSEYMACGKPAIATFHSGHKDILTEENSFPLKAQVENVITNEAGPVGRWCETDLDEAIETLEYAYQNRELLRTKGAAAAKTFERLTWEQTAREFYGLLNS